MTASQLLTAGTVVLVLDLLGTFVFALSGAIAGIKHGLDLFGVLVVSFAAGNFGGIMRDLLIGAVPPPGIADWRYIAVSVLAGVITFRWGSIVDRMQSSVLIFDAAGLGLFAVSGALKALDFHLGPVAAVLLGMLTGIGGGMVRDILVREIPSVLRGGLYAIPALVGAGIVVGAYKVGDHTVTFPIVGAAVCFLMRIAGLRYGLGLPSAADVAVTAMPRVPRRRRDER
jgi:uncharacterized membrane protein YeiH